ncbi:unnamed protein product [Peronospora effusa]|nr:unnamed protein product [Peronospora effusa]
MWCKFHKTKSHNSSECFTLKKQLEEHKPAEIQTTVSSKNNYPRFEEEESDSDSESNSEIKLVGLVAKKHTSTKLAPLRIKVQLKNANGIFDALLDSGASISIFNQKTMQANVQLGRKQVASSTKFQTVNGEVTSDGSAVVQFRFASLKPSAIITHRFEILEKSQDAMVIVRDIMTSLGIVLDFKKKVVQWDGHYAHLNTGGSRSFEVSDYELFEESKEIAESAVQPEELMPDTLPNSLVDEYHQLLRDNESLYDGHLGRMRFEDYILPISPDYKPVNAKPYPVPRSLEGKARELSQHLVSIDVLEKIYDSEMASPAFFLKKPNGSLRLLIDFPKCLSTLDANMGYYARRLATSSRNYTAFC